MEEHNVLFRTKIVIFLFIRIPLNSLVSLLFYLDIYTTPPILYLLPWQVSYSKEKPKKEVFQSLYMFVLNWMIELVYVVHITQGSPGGEMEGGGYTCHYSHIGFLSTYTNSNTSFILLPVCSQNSTKRLSSDGLRSFANNGDQGISLSRRYFKLNYRRKVLWGAVCLQVRWLRAVGVWRVAAESPESAPPPTTSPNKKPGAIAKDWTPSLE